MSNRIDPARSNKVLNEKILFPAFGGGADINSWSGTPYFLLRAAAAADFPLLGVSVPAPADLRVARWLWRAWRLLTLRKVGGFSMTEACLRGTWDDLDRFPRGARILSYFSLLSTRMLDRVENGEVELNYYIDMTYREFIERYPEGRGADRALTARSFDRERRGYRLARKICTFSRASADFICREYGIPREKVRVVRGGANITANLLDKPRMPPGPAEFPFIIGFVGMDWKRKGLPRLVAVLPRLRRSGRDVRLRVIGTAPAEIRAIEGVDFIGRIDKENDMDRYVALLRECHIGVLLSDAEALGIAGLEFLSLGVPVLATAIGGLFDFVTDGVGVLVPPDISEDNLARCLESLIGDQRRLEIMAAAAYRRRSEYQWSASIDHLRSILNDDG